MMQAEAMKNARLKVGMSATDLARAAGVSRPTIVDLEDPAKNRYGRLDTVILLADALGLSIDEYVGHEAVKRNAEE